MGWRSFFRRLAATADGRWAGLLILLPLVLWRGLAPDPMPQLRRAWFDAIQASLPGRFDPTDAPVRIVAIDDDALQEVGQWPWPRTDVARLVRAVADAGALVLGFDILFEEPDRMAPQRFAMRPDLDSETRRALMRLPANDEVLREALDALPVVVGLGGVGQGGFPGVPRPVPVTFQGPDARERLSRFVGVVGTLEPVIAGSVGRGLLNQRPDPDGRARQVPMIALVGTQLAPALTTELLRLVAGAEGVEVDTDAAGVRALALGAGADAIRIPTAADGTLYARAGPSHPLRYVSASRLLAGDPAVTAELDGKIVLVGFTALGLADVVATPVAARIPGVEVHAQILESLLAVDPRRGPIGRPGGVGLLETGATLALAGAMVVLTPMLPAALGLALPVLVAAGAVGAAWLAYDVEGRLVDLAFPLAAAVVVWIAMTMLGFMREAAERRRAEQALQAQRLAAAKLDGELSAARTIQMGILPRVFPAFPGRREFDLHALIEPAKQIGGDLYDFALIGERLYFTVGDVSGKGVPASLFMALSKALLRSSALRLGGDVEGTVTLANTEIGRENAANLFVTLIVGVLDLATGKLVWCNAGHDPPYLLAPEGGQPKPLAEGGGPPLCMVEEFPYAVETRVLAPGEALLLYTDGVAEAVDPDGALYGLARLEARLAGLTPTASAREMATLVFEDVKAFARGADPSDDITILALRWHGPAA
jgi:serine phosphatase RsbU (regulator of sigma subunit)